MRNQFFYTRKVEDKEFRDSFNIDMVIRTVSIESGETIVLLDDLHELTKEVPEINPKTNRVTRLKKVTENVQSEIYLNKEDAERFYKLTEHKE